MLATGNLFLSRNERRRHDELMSRSDGLSKSELSESHHHTINGVTFRYGWITAAIGVVLFLLSFGIGGY